MSSQARPLSLFEATGIEIEYMIVDRDSLDVRPIADELIRAEAGTIESEIERGAIAWSNELALHVIELKTNGPASDLAVTAELLQAEVRHIAEILRGQNAILLPGAMHPWMDPDRELRLWPHEYNPIYETFDRIFGCRGHGWANLQSVHVNLPFADDRELAALHGAIRMLMPIMPALSASSPIVDGSVARVLDARLAAYRDNAARVPSVSGAVVPEAILTRAQYEDEILGRIYRDLAPLDPEGVLRHEWVNARGCIARFDRMALEIRVLDTQEHPAADVAIASALSGVLRHLVDNGVTERAEIRNWPTARLAAILDDTIRDADRATIADADYREALGVRTQGATRAIDLWSELLESIGESPRAGRDALDDALRVILDEGCLARRLLRRIDGDTRREALREVYAELGECLLEGRSLRARA